LSFESTKHAAINPIVRLVVVAAHKILTEPFSSILI